MTTTKIQRAGPTIVRRSAAGDLTIIRREVLNATVATVGVQGKVNQLVNVGGEEELVVGRVGDTVSLRTLEAGDGITVTEDDDTLVIAAGLIDVQDASGGGSSLVKGTTAKVALIKSLLAGAGITLTPGANSVTIDASGIESVATDVALLALTRTDGAAAYSQDADILYNRQAGAWVKMLTAQVGKLTLAQIITAVGSSNITVTLARPITVAASATVPATMRLNFVDGGRLDIASGQTLTLRGPITAPRQQIFSYADGTCVVTFGTTNTSGRTTLYPEWWGAMGDSSTDDTTAIQRMFDVPSQYTQQLEYHFTSGRTYKTTSTLYLGMTMTASSWIVSGYGSYISNASFTNAPVVQIGKYSTLKKSFFARWLGLNIQRTSGASMQTGSSGVCIDYADFTTFRDCQFDGFYYGILTTNNGGNSTLFDHVSISGGHYGAYLGFSVNNFNVWRWIGGKIQQCVIGIYGAGAQVEIENVDFSLHTQSAIRLENCGVARIKVYTEGIGPQSVANTSAVMYFKNTAFMLEGSVINGTTTVGGSYTKNCGYGVYIENCSNWRIDNSGFTRAQKAHIYIDADSSDGWIGATNYVDENRDANITHDPQPMKIVNLGKRIVNEPRVRERLPRLTYDRRQAGELQNWVTAPCDFSDASWVMTNGLSVVDAVTAPDGHSLAQVLRFPNTSFAGDTAHPSILNLTFNYGSALDNKVFVVRYWIKLMAINTPSVYDEQRFRALIGVLPADANGRYDEFYLPNLAGGEWQFIERVHVQLVNNASHGTQLRALFNCVSDGLDVALWGFQVIVCDSEAEAYANLAQHPQPGRTGKVGTKQIYGALDEAPRALMHGKELVREIVAEDSPEDLDLNPPSGDDSWRVGDYCWNSAPTAGSYIGWRNTVAGAPGTWEPMAPALGEANTWSEIQTFEDNITVGDHFAVQASDGHVGIAPFGDPHFYEAFNIEDGNFLMQGAGETGWIMKRVGDYGPYENPAFAVGRIFRDSAIGAMEFRVMFYDDNIAEHPVLEIEDTGTIASIRNGDRGSHYEGWLENGDTKPVFRASSYPSMQYEAGIGGDTDTDVSWARTASAVWTLMNGVAANGGGTLELLEISDPGVAQTNGARLFVKDNGSGKTQLCVRYHTGAARVLDTEA